ncbi:hypothetical protein [Staphylococcus shinii]|uniref:hypothetical protein n=1 Tax=Staphylococcus shinii TaxID=2912228 RepID=UPI003F875226
MNSINNKTLLTEVQRLDYETTKSKIHARECEVKVATLRRAFGVKNYEDEKPKSQFEDYERVQIQTNEEIKKNLKEDIASYQSVSNSKSLLHLQEYYYYSIIFTIESVEFFNPELAEELKTLLSDSNVVLSLYKQK